MLTMDMVGGCGRMNDLRFYILFNSISVISGRWADCTERLSTVVPSL